MGHGYRNLAYASRLKVVHASFDPWSMEMNLCCGRSALAGVWTFADPWSSLALIRLAQNWLQWSPFRPFSEQWLRRNFRQNLTIVHLPQQYLCSRNFWHQSSLYRTKSSIGFLFVYGSKVQALSRWHQCFRWDIGTPKRPVFFCPGQVGALQVQKTEFQSNICLLKSQDTSSPIGREPYPIDKPKAFHVRFCSVMSQACSHRYARPSRAAWHRDTSFWVPRWSRWPASDLRRVLLDNSLAWVRCRSMLAASGMISKRDRCFSAHLKNYLTGYLTGRQNRGFWHSNPSSKLRSLRSRSCRCSKMRGF